MQHHTVRRKIVCGCHDTAHTLALQAVARISTIQSLPLSILPDRRRPSLSAKLPLRGSTQMSVRP